jgi:SAM-dependent methyltransferase
MKFLKSLRLSNTPPAKKDGLQEYFSSGCLPFSVGYDIHRSQLIEKTLADDSLMDRFRRHESLPAEYGQYVDERVVEYPWLLSRLAPGTDKTLLDAGSTLNNLTILEHHSLAPYQKFIVTLAPEPVSYWQRGISYVFDDLRDLLFKDSYFDVVTSISTLEHIGMDNTALYTGDASFKENIHDDYLKVIREFHRVLKPGGVCYITVPFGQYQYDVFQQQFNAEMLDNVIKVFKPAKAKEYYFKYDASGWNTAKREECTQARYFNVHKTKYFDTNSTLDFDLDKAAAARAVAALELIK